ncbi:MAG TPA: Rap1a/Tai family immunity protein [Spirochaetia bacterium]
MKRIITILAILGLVATAAVADSSVGNAKWLHDKWMAIKGTDVTNSMDLAVYDGFVMGVVQVAQHTNPSPFAIPEGTTLGQLFTTVGGYLESHPDEWSVEAGVVVVRALQHRYPSAKTAQR